MNVKGGLRGYFQGEINASLEIEPKVANCPPTNLLVKDIFTTPFSSLVMRRTMGG
jgi:hypothetical protein